MASAALKQDFTPIRFYVEWHPTDEVEAECIKQGMKPDDGTSFWDWVEIYDHVSTRDFTDFDAAVAYAKQVSPQDCFASPRIYRQQQIVEKAGARSVIRWIDECYWDGIGGDDQPDISKPDEWCE